MKIRVNGNFLEIDNSKTLQDFIDRSVTNSTSIVAELNGDIIKKPRWNDTCLNDGDTLELVALFGGG